MGMLNTDGDSLVYYMTPALTANSTTLATYNSPYTYLQPLPGANLVLDSSTGQLTFSATATGVYVVDILVEEYDRVSGIKKGEINRDFQVVVQNCSNNNPAVNTGGISNYTGGGSRIDSTHIGVCEGDSFSFDVTLSDIETAQILSINHDIFDALDSTAIVTVTGTNPTTVHVSWRAKYEGRKNRIFRIQASDDACPIFGSTYFTGTITVSQSVVTIDDITICAGSQWVNLTTENNLSNLSWAAILGAPIVTDTNSSLYNFSCVVCSSPDVSPQVTSTYVVTGNNTNGCPNSDTVTVTVAPDFTLTVTNDTVLCSSDSVSLNATVFPTGNNFTYHWAPSIHLDFDSVNNPKAFSGFNEDYKVVVRSSQGCVKEGTVSIDIAKYFPSSINISGDAVICVGDTANLVLNLNGPTFSCGISSLECIGNNNSIIIGTGISTNTYSTYPAPYGSFSIGAVHQLLYTAEELRAMGMQSGMISAISFDISTLGSTRLFQNYEVKMSCTSSNNLNSGWETGLTTVKNSYTHLAHGGWNKHSFDSAYSWDGISNIIIQICYTTSTTSLTASSLSPYSTTTFESVRYALSGCNTGTPGYTSRNRPNIKFDYCSGVNPDGFNYVWTPSSSVDATLPLSPLAWPLVNTNYQLVVSDTNSACSKTVSYTVNTTLKFDAGFSAEAPYCLNDPTVSFSPVKPGGTFTGAGILANGTFDPSDAGVGTWPINYNLSHPICANDSTILVQVLALPDASFIAPEICVTSNNLVTIVPTVPGGTWSGYGIVDSVNGVFNSTNLPLGDYPVAYTVTQNCTNTDTLNVRIIPPYEFRFNNATVKVCENSTVDLSTSYQMSSNPSQGSGPIIETWSSTNGNVNSNGVFDAVGLALGSYQVDLTITGTDGTCGTTESVTVQVTEVKYAEVLDALKYCLDESNVKIYISPWMFGTGIQFTQTALPPLAIGDTLNITAFGQNGQFNPKDKGAGSWEINFTRTTLEGCVGVITDTIYVLESPTGDVSNDGTTLTSDDAAGNTFQWLDCDFGNSPITGATNQSYTPGRAGHFAVEVTAGSCSITSSCYETWPVSVQNASIDLGISVYPNPIENELNIDLGNNAYLDIEITDNAGKVVLTQTTKSKVTKLDLSHLSSGVYLIKTKNDLGEQVQKIVKK
jgi:hypothetical protein